MSRLTHAGECQRFARAADRRGRNTGSFGGGALLPPKVPTRRVVPVLRSTVYSGRPAHAPQDVSYHTAARDSMWCAAVWLSVLTLMLLTNSRFKGDTLHVDFS